VPALTEAESVAVVAFLEALPDDRVRFRKAPVDAPDIFVPNGHLGDHTRTADADGDGQADDLLVRVPAVGTNGGPELPGFLVFPWFRPRRRTVRGACPYHIRSPPAATSTSPVT
jgi:hypothetical protein